MKREGKDGGVERDAEVEGEVWRERCGGRGVEEEV